MRKTESGLTDPSAAPNQEALEAFLRGDLSGREAERVAKWLETHPEVWDSLSARVEAGAESNLEDDLRWAKQLRDKTQVDITVPLTRLRELLPEYEILEEIGRGGMGIVFRARHHRLERNVAIKVLPALLGAVRPEGVSRFRREAALAARLRHNNIITVHDYGEAEGTLYYTMDLVEGRSLHDVLSEINETGAIDVVLGAGNRTESNASGNDQGPSTPTRLDSSAGAARHYYRRVAQWMADVAEALQHAHEQGVIHRDLKPSNLMLGGDGRVMITDFGLARAEGHSAMTASRALVGTARYMSPEQVDPQRGRIDARTDVYGLGATMYEFLAFRPMFPANRDTEVLRQVIDDEPARPQRIIAWVPTELEVICLKAIEKDPTKRYESARALADDLRRWLLDLPISARRPTVLARAAKFVRRRKVVSALAASLALVLIVSGVLYAGYHRSRRMAAEVGAIAESRGMHLAYLEARSELLNGSARSALRKIDDALRDYSDRVEFHVLRSRVLRYLRREDEAVQCLEDILAREPECRAAHYQLCLAYKDSEDQEKFARHREQVERLKSDTPEARILQIYAEQDSKRAIQMLNEFLEDDPSRLEAVVERANRYDELKDYDAMLLDAERAVGLRPAWSITHDLMGQALLGLKRYADAVQSLSRAIELSPQVAGYRVNRGLANCGLTRFSEAIADANSAIELDPEMSQAYLCRARALGGQGNFDDALVNCDQAVELDPTNVEAYLQRGALYGQAGRWEDAIADSARVIQLNPDDPRGYQNRGVAYMRTQRFDRAIADVSRYIELEPDDASAYRSRGDAYAYTGQHPRAIDDYTRAIQLDPTFSDSFRDRSTLYVRDGQYEAAIGDLTHVISLAPSDVVAILRRGMAYELLDADEPATADYDRIASRRGPAGEYARLWKYILLQMKGRKDEASGILASHPTSVEFKTWTDRLYELFLGTLSPEDLLTAAVTDDERAEAHYYIGCKALIDGKNDDAAKAFRSCVDLKRTNILETDFARARLERLSNDTPTIPSPASAP